MEYRIYLVCVLLCAARSIHTSATCSDANEIRLANYTESYYGYIQLRHNCAWGYIHGPSFSQELANIACRQLGFTKILRFDTHAVYLDQRLLLHGFQCPKNATNLLKCPYSSTGKITSTFLVARAECEVDCGEPLVGVKSNVSWSNTTLGSTATYTCLPNTMHLSGNATLSCNGSGLWEGGEYACGDLQCSVRKNITNGMVLGGLSQVTVQSLAPIECSPGYRFTGRFPMAKCTNLNQSYADWELRDGSCELVPPTLVLNSTSTEITVRVDHMLSSDPTITYCTVMTSMTTGSNISNACNTSASRTLRHRSADDVIEIQAYVILGSPAETSTRSYPVVLLPFAKSPSETSSCTTGIAIGLGVGIPALVLLAALLIAQCRRMRAGQPTAASRTARDTTCKTDVVVIRNSSAVPRGSRDDGYEVRDLSDKVHDSREAHTTTPRHHGELGKSLRNARKSLFQREKTTKSVETSGSTGEGRMAAVREGSGDVAALGNQTRYPANEATDRCTSSRTVTPNAKHSSSRKTTFRSVHKKRASPVVNDTTAESSSRARRSYEGTIPDEAEETYEPMESDMITGFGKVNATSRTAIASRTSGPIARQKQLNPADYSQTVEDEDAINYEQTIPVVPSTYEPPTAMTFGTNDGACKPALNNLPPPPPPSNIADDFYEEANSAPSRSYEARASNNRNGAGSHDSSTPYLNTAGKPTGHQPWLPFQPRAVLSRISTQKAQDDPIYMNYK
eukprot:scpid44853/ scgid25791/ 